MFKNLPAVSIKKTRIEKASPTPMIKNGAVRSTRVKDLGLFFDETFVWHCLKNLVKRLLINRLAISIFSHYNHWFYIIIYRLKSRGYNNSKHCIDHDSPSMKPKNKIDIYFILSFCLLSLEAQYWWVLAFILWSYESGKPNGEKLENVDIFTTYHFRNVFIQ